jgi:hypothetical protein
MISYATPDQFVARKQLFRPRDDHSRDEMIFAERTDQFAPQQIVSRHEFMIGGRYDQFVTGKNYSPHEIIKFSLFKKISLKMFINAQARGS